MSVSEEVRRAWPADGWLEHEASAFKGAATRLCLAISDVAGSRRVDFRRAARGGEQS
jgi:hypothetical protein